MKRIPRLRQPSAVLTQCLQSSTTSSTHPAVSRAAATTATAMATTSRLARPRDFSTTTPMPFRPSPTPWAADTSVSKVQEQVEPSLLTTASEEPVDLQSEPYDDQTEAEFADEIAPEDLIETDLVIPSSSQDFELAPRSDDLEAGGVVDYKPAETAEGLDIVGGTTDWFSKDEHLPPSKLDSFERFAPKTLIDDPAELELCVCRAVVETLAVEQARPHQLLGRPWATRLTKKGSKLRPHIIEFNDGKARLKGGVVQILELLFPDKKAKESSSTAEIEYPNSIKAHTAYAKMATDWKKVSLTDVKFRFAVLKRVFQLTGHRIPDAKILNLEKASDLLALVVKPPAPRSVYETIHQVGVLPHLPNVEIHEKRRTPITEAQKVGSWKVIKDILEKRNLPVTGHQSVGKFVEDDWYRGPRVVKKKRSRRT